MHRYFLGSGRDGSTFSQHFSPPLPRLFDHHIFLPILSATSPPPPLSGRDASPPPPPPSSLRGRTGGGGLEEKEEEKGLRVFACEPQFLTCPTGRGWRRRPRRRRMRHTVRTAQHSTNDRYMGRGEEGDEARVKKIEETE